jgi:hypothetical protein
MPDDNALPEIIKRGAIHEGNQSIYLNRFTGNRCALQILNGDATFILHTNEELLRKLGNALAEHFGCAWYDPKEDADSEMKP